MKISRPILVDSIICLFFILILTGCSWKKPPITKSQATYNIIGPVTSNILKNMTINIKEDQVSFLSNNRVAAVAKVRPAPPPPPPCSGCKPPAFIFTLTGRNTAEIYYPELDRRFALDIINMSDELLAGIRSLPNQSFEAQPIAQGR